MSVDAFSQHLRINVSLPEVKQHSQGASYHQTTRKIQCCRVTETYLDSINVPLHQPKTQTILALSVQALCYMNLLQVCSYYLLLQCSWTMLSFEQDCKGNQQRNDK